MTTFVRGRTLRTSDATVVVDAGLAIGTHRFQLVAVTADGRQSVPDVVDIVVARVVVGPVRPPLTGGIGGLATPVVTPAVTPIRVPVRPRASKPRKAAKTRSET
ncbi:MAG TPA: hypothetical protein PLC86_22625 [Candidatus Accumulibacter phosphatis]|nr:hypothetical protein [Candidatus Accumulibacter phosphatis]